MNTALFVTFWIVIAFIGWLVVGFLAAWLFGKVIALADRLAARRADPGTVLTFYQPPVPHPSTLPRRCPAIRDEGQCDLDADHAGTHVHVVTDDQEVVFWGAAA